MTPKRIRFRGACVTTLLITLLLSGAQARTWTNADGARTFEGDLESYDEATGEVVVIVPGGSKMNFKQDVLSAEDIVWLKTRRTKSSGGIKKLPDELPDPDGKEADMSRPVQVYLLLGQSNMLGMGKISGGEGSLENAVKAKDKYPHLVDEAGNWTERKDVRNVRVMVGKGGMQVFNNEWMAIGKGKIGPEFGLGHCLGEVTEAPVMILKSCIGNRSLGWDLLPPGSEQFEYEGKIYAGYKESPDSWAKGAEPKPIGWYAGKQYDDDTANAKKVLAELDEYYPGAKEYEIAGFFFWQGDKDRYNAAHASRYERNLVHFIHQVRKDFEAPTAKFVVATLGQTKKGADGNEGKVLDAQLAVDGESGRYPEFKGNVATVYSNPFCHGGASNSHYGGNAETYMDIGEAMGRAMVELLAQ